MWEYLITHVNIYTQFPTPTLHTPAYSHTHTHTHTFSCLTFWKEKGQKALEILE